LQAVQGLVKVPMPEKCDVVCLGRRSDLTVTRKSSPGPLNQTMNTSEQVLQDGVPPDRATYVDARSQLKPT
jgi:hypothetical protein